MSKISDLVIKAQEMACEYYNLDRKSFRKAIEKEFTNHQYRPIMIQAAYQSYDEIQNEMNEWHSGAFRSVA